MGHSISNRHAEGPPRRKRQQPANFVERAPVPGTGKYYYHSLPEVRCRRSRSTGSVVQRESCREIAFALFHRFHLV